MIIRAFFAISAIGLLGAGTGEAIKVIDPNTSLPLGIVGAVVVTVASGSVWVGMTFRGITDELRILKDGFNGLPCKRDMLPCQSKKDNQ